MRRLLVALATCLGCSRDPSATLPAPATSASPAPPPSTSALPASATERPRTRALGSIASVAVGAVPPFGFDKLTSDQRALVFHLSQAAIASDPLLFMQASRHAWPITRLVARMLQRKTELDPAFREALQDYRRQLFLHHGLHDTLSSQKLTPSFTRPQLEAAAKTLGIAIPPEILPVLFDPKVEPFQVDKQAKDPVVASAANHYQDVTSQDLTGFKDKYELNGRVTKVDGKLVEEVYRAGGQGAAPGLGARELQRVVEHLRKAAPLAPADERAGLELLIQYFETGEADLFRRHDIAWLKQVHPVDYVLGFIEVYTDVRAKKGAWEALVTIPDPQRDGPMQALAANAAFFEKRMPWDGKWKRESFRTPASAAVRAMAATGAAGPIGYVGKNLPNPQVLRETYGTKNFVVVAWMDAYGDLHGTRRLDEFAPEEVRAEVGRCASALGFANIALHEVTGHGSGKVDPSLKADPAEVLGADYSTMEEGRAQLVGDYLLMDPKMLEIGLLPDAGCQRAAAAWSTAGLLMWHAAVAQGEVVEEDHMRGGMIQLGYLIDKGVVKPEVRGGKTFLLVPDPDAWQRALGELLGEHQRIRATGDKAAMKALVDKWGSRLNPRWRDEVLARLKALSLPPATALIPPMLAPVLGEGGKVVDATATQATSVDEYIAYLEAAWVD